jgi:ribonuclease Z
MMLDSRDEMIEVRAGPFTLRGVSVGGAYTAIHVPELDVLLDIGAPARTFGAVSRLFLSHAHADHAGALFTLLGIRRLNRVATDLDVYVPAAVVDEIAALLAAMARLHDRPMPARLVPMAPGDEQVLRPGLVVRAFPTLHRVPSLGYLFVERVEKLRPELAGLTGPQIARRRHAGENVSVTVERPLLAYVTDTRASILDETPAILDARVLVLECTFFDPERGLERAHETAHVHLDEIVARAGAFHNETLVLMHFTQALSPAEVRAELARRCPPALLERIVAFTGPAR